MIASAVMMLGYQKLLFAAVAMLSRHGARLNSPHPGERALAQSAKGPWLPLLGTVKGLVGLAVCLSFTWQWSRAGYGPLNPEVGMWPIIPGVALLFVGSQTLLAAVFFAAQRAAFDCSRSAPGSESNQPSWRKAGS